MKQAGLYNKSQVIKQPDVMMLFAYQNLDMPESTYGYLMETAEMDLKNMHGGTQDGIHSGCAAGAWMAVVRGVAGMRMTMDKVTFTPHYIPWWKQVRFHCVWHDQGYQVILSNSGIQVIADEDNQGALSLSIFEKEYQLGRGEKAAYEFLKTAFVR